MNILFLMGSGPHPHDYGVDFLYDGLCTELGVEAVWDWPVKPTLHLAAEDQRDACGLDSDQAWPLRANHEVDIADLARAADVVLLGVPPDIHALERAATAARLIPAETPVVVYDASDAVRDLRPLYADVIGGRAALYCKRELPLGADWGRPLPLCYPARRAPSPLPPKFPRVFYHATSHMHDGRVGPPGLPRVRIVNEIRALVPPTQRNVELFPSQQGRPTPEAYHAEMARALVGVSWNGAENWDCNRFWEHFAFGVCQVAETPRIQMPFPPQHMEHCLYAAAPEQVARAVGLMLSHPQWAADIAAKGRAHFHAHHSSVARARQLLGYIADG